MLRSLALPLEPGLALRTRASDGTVAVALQGPLGAGTSAALSAWGLRRLPSRTRLLVVDLAGVPEVDAVGLGALLALRRRIVGEVVVTGAAPRVLAALQRAGATALLRCEGDQGRAAA